MECNCKEPGYCPRFGANLHGTTWKQAHNIDCTMKQHLHVVKMLSGMKSTGVKPYVKPTGPSKGCNCGKDGSKTAQNAPEIDPQSQDSQDVEKQL